MKKHLLLPILFPFAPCLCEAQAGADTKTVFINPEMPPNPPQKAGYKLVFSEEFDGAELDTLHWCPWGDRVPGECEPRCFATNDPANVTVKDGVCRLATTVAASGSCDFKTAEIKSFRYPPEHFKGWYVEPGSYLEIRAKMPHGGNTGCAGWLYTLGPNNGYREIDIWEIWSGDDSRYQINRHVGDGGAGDPFKVKVRDLNGNKIHMSEQFLTFGVDWQRNNIGFYLNGRFVAEYCCFDPEKQFFWPMSLRLSAGILSLEGDCPESAGLPQAMEVDYVRYYVRDTAHPLFLTKMTDTVQVDQQGKFVVCCPSVWVNYIPGVQYEASSPAAGLDIWTTVPDAYVWGFTPHPGLPRDTAYPIRVVAHFPEPHSYSDTLNTYFFLTEKPLSTYLAPNRIFSEALQQARVYPTLLRGGEALCVETPFFYTLMQIVAADGRVLQDEILTAGKGLITLPADFSPGLYWVKLHSDCGLKTYKILIY